MRSATRSSAASPRTSPARVKDALGYKVHWTLPDYLQRSARHLASKTDLEQAQAVGKAAVEFALQGHERGDAGDRAHVRCAVSLEDRGRAAVEDRQPREEDAGRLHPQGRLRHHRRRAPLPRAADPRRGAAAVRARRPAEVRGAEERRGEEEAAGIRQAECPRPEADVSAQPDRWTPMRAAVALDGVHTAR